MDAFSSGIAVQLTPRCSGHISPWSPTPDCTSRLHFVDLMSVTVRKTATCPDLTLVHPRLIPEGHNAFVYIIDGEGNFAGEEADKHHCLILSHEVGEDGPSPALQDISGDLWNQIVSCLDD